MLAGVVVPCGLNWSAGWWFVVLSLCGLCWRVGPGLRVAVVMMFRECDPVCGLGSVLYAGGGVWLLRVGWYIDACGLWFAG